LRRGSFTVDSFGTGLIVQSLISYWFFTRFGVQPGSLGALFFASSLLTAISLWVATRLARRIGLLNTIVFTHIPSSLFLIAVPFVPDAWMAVTLWLLRAFFAQMDAPTSQSYHGARRSRRANRDGECHDRDPESECRAGGRPVGGVVKIAYDLTLWWMFRRVKPPEDVPSSA
jgi:MFS family permease